MKQRWIIALALCVVMALSVFAIAEDGMDAVGAPDLGDVGEMEIQEQGDGEQQADEMDGVTLGDLVPAVEDAPEEEFVAVYRFMVDGELYAVQEVRDGEELLKPEGPAAPEGMTFVGWALESGEALFTDADGDGVIDPVIARPEAPWWEVNAVAVFAPSEAPQPGAETAEAEESEETSEEEDSEEAAAEQEASEEQEAPAQEPPVANEGLIYNGEAQALVSAEGAWLYSMDGLEFTDSLPTGTDAGEYTVYFLAAGDDAAQAQSLTVGIAKADVLLTPPVAAEGEY